MHQPAAKVRVKRGTAQQRDYAESDARMALAEARTRQIGCLSVSVGVARDGTRLRDTFGARDYLWFGSWDELRGDLAPLLRSAIRASR